ncbi:MAG: lysophospholipid acyltransferase family protein [Acidobacteriota bacterium]|nr:lysophospholipid acyltransferase family protein [Acidobacteriota bacterium]
MRCRRSIFYWPWKLFSVLVCLVFRLRVNVTGQENIRQGYEKRHLFICNHQSALDIPILVSVFTIPFLTKQQNLWIPFLGLAGLMAGSVTVDRSSNCDRLKAIKKVLDRIENITSLYVFPEGTRSRTGQPQKQIFQAVLRAAWRRRINVVPLGLHGSHLVIGHQPQTHSGYPVHIHIGKVVDTSNFPDDKVFAEHCWQQVLELHSKAKADLEAEVAASKLKYCELSAKIPESLREDNKQPFPE